MDRLDRLLSTAGPLLRRVDEVLGAGGAPPEHRVWAELRRVRLLPGDAARGVAALRPEELREVAPELRADARAYAVLATSLPVPKSWTGEAADAYAAARQIAADHLSGTTESLDDRLQASADLADALVTWMRGARDALAGVLAEVLISTEALALAGNRADLSLAGETQAAADVAAEVLTTIADVYEEAEQLLYSTADLAEPVALSR